MKTLTMEKAYNIISNMPTRYDEIIKNHTDNSTWSSSYHIGASEYRKEAVDEALEIINKYYPNDFGLESFNKMIKEFLRLSREESYFKDFKSKNRKEVFDNIIDILRKVV